MSKWIAISKSSHSTARWKPREGFAFARQEEVAPVYMAELGKLVPRYVLGFVKAGPKYKFACVLGVGNQKNYYINSDNKWLCDYVPAHYRKHPFGLVDTDQSKKVFCVKDDALSSSDEDQPIFAQDGNLSPVTNKMLEFLATCDESEDKTDSAVSLLNELGLLVPRNYKINTQSMGEIVLSGLYAVDEEKLQQLDSSNLERLNHAGVLKLAHAQIFSSQNTEQLSTRIDLLNTLPKVKEEPTIGAIFDENKTLNFDAFL